MDSVQPLRISKAAPFSSPDKMAAATSRPLSEIGNTERRRNSPSYNQATRVGAASTASVCEPYAPADNRIQKMLVTREASPYTENSSPPSFAKASPRDFWAGRDPMSPTRFDNENTPDHESSPSSSPKRRPSVERLFQASRVRNSNIFALENKDAYDPSSLPIVERPSANRPLSQQLANNSFARFDTVNKKENNPLRSPGGSGHRRTDSEINVPTLTPTKSPARVPLPASPEKQGSPSPTKSSLARTSQFGISPQTSFDPENGTWSDDETISTPRALQRHAKSVTFHHDPPIINEYEQQTPEPSVSAASDREGSWDSEDFEDADFSFDRGSSADPDRDDSFDADLENADKTPVVLPEDWSRMSPEEARTDLVDANDDVFDKDAVTERELPLRVASEGDSRPLPPLPGFLRQDRRGSDSLVSAAERAAHTPRNVPSPPKRASCSKDEILKMTSNSVMSLQERHGLLSQQDERQASKSPAALGSGPAIEEKLTVTNLDTGEKVTADDSLLGDLSELTKAPPRISRESILRKVRNTKYDFEDEDEEENDSGTELGANDQNAMRPTIAELAKMDPDQPIPSRENSRENSGTYADYRATTSDDEPVEVAIKQEPIDEDVVDMSTIPAAPQEELFEDYERQSSVLRHYSEPADQDEDDTESRYSSIEPDVESTTIHVQAETPERDDGKETLQEAMQLLCVKDYSETRQQGSGDFTGLPTYLSTDDWTLGMKDYITPSPPASSSENLSKQTEAVPRMPSLQPPINLEREITRPLSLRDEPEISPPGTPGSVLHNGSAGVSPLEEQYDPLRESASQESASQESDAVSDRFASIKTPGSKLRARPSATPADLVSMGVQRRLVSAEQPMSAIPRARSPEPQVGDTGAQLSRDASGSLSSLATSDESTAAFILGDEAVKPEKDRRKSRKSGGRMDLLLDTSSFSLHDDGGLELDEDFDRVIESQKVGNLFPAPMLATESASQQQLQSHPLPEHDRSLHVSQASSAGADLSTIAKKGYLMRHNTKVVVASNRNFSGDSNETAKSAPIDENIPPAPSTIAAERPSSRDSKGAKSSPRKPSADQYLKTEPWNGKARRKSLRNISAQKAAYSREAAPPLPGQESALGVVDEDCAAGASILDEDIGEGVERGRLFVKVVGVKKLDLPLPRRDRLHFQLTLDNGLHCVTTASLELGTTAPIGQEFELVVQDDLEFQLTLTTKLPPPPATPTPSTTSSTSPTKPKHSKSSSFSRFLSSPKKRAEKERQEREAAEAEERRVQEESQRKRASIAPTAWDLLHDLIHPSDGSFARAYVNLKSHEKSCFGRQLSVDVPCYNEWALENDVHVVNSVRSKRGASSGPIRRPPYVVGQLELQLLYVPKPKSVADEDMPKSMSAAVREMKKAGEVKEHVHEGHLSQQGGDCVHWRRRFFRLQGSKLTAYHEHTHQKRAVINLSKASRLVDDKTTLVADPSSSPSKSRNNKNRRKSAFAEEDEGYAYVEEGFRIRFANGETIDFYGDSREAKDQWMSALSQVIGMPDAGQKAMTWTDVVLARERSLGVTSNGSNSDANKSSAAVSPTKMEAPAEVKESTRPQIAQHREIGHRKPVLAPPSTNANYQATKSAQTSPAKGHVARSAPVPPPASPAKRPRTPPMSERKGHRSRDAVKSMIF